MRPRSLDRGNVVWLLVLALLAHGFNEASISRSRKYSNGQAVYTDEGDASMRPRSLDRGNNDSGIAFPDHRLASMRPRSLDRGNIHSAERLEESGIELQ